MKQLVPIIMMFLFLGVVVGANIYLSMRFSWYFGMKSTRSMYFLFVAATILMIGGVAGFTNSTSFPGHVLYSVGAFLMGFLLYLLLSLLVVELARLVVKVQPFYYGVAVLVMALTVSAYATWNAFQVRTTEIEVGVKGLQQEVRAMHLSDIHLGHFRGEKFLHRIVDRCNSRDVDMVLITGDLFDGKIRFCDACLDPLKQLNAPVYFVEGNHDGYSGIERVKSSLKAIGVKVLSNDVASQGEIQIIGLNHMLADENSVNMHTAGELATLRSILPGIPSDPDKPTILLHHSPDGIQYAREKGVDLYLAGHTHAGQLFPVNFIGELIYQFNKGLHDYQGTKIYVSSGAGTFGPPMRFGTHSEITVVKLIPKKQ
ncbi:MAG: metallophosphoesterase [Bacteroidetes bacterium]|nr:metallophosphoesterase [Bacteroidota bacterium]